MSQTLHAKQLQSIKGGVKFGPQLFLSLLESISDSFEGAKWLLAFDMFPLSLYQSPPQASACGGPSEQWNVGQSLRPCCIPMEDFSFVYVFLYFHLMPSSLVVTTQSMFC